MHKPINWSALWSSIERWLVGNLAANDVAHVDIVVRKLPIADGDIVMVMCDQPLSQHSAESIRRHVQDVLDQSGRDAKVLVLDKGVSVSVLKTSQIPTTMRPALPPDSLHIA